MANYAQPNLEQYPFVPVLPEILPNKWISVTGIQGRRLYALISCVAYLERAIHPDSLFPHKLKALLSEHPNVDVAAMGFPIDWESEPLWR